VSVLRVHYAATIAHDRSRSLTRAHGPLTVLVHGALTSAHGVSARCAHGRSRSAHGALTVAHGKTWNPLYYI